MSKSTIEMLWEELDAQIELAVPLQRKLRELQKNEPGDTVGIANLQIEKYKAAGFAPGLAQALCLLLRPAFPDYQAVVKHAQARYKARQAGEPLPDTPTLPMHLPAPAPTPTAVSVSSPPIAPETIPESPKKTTRRKRDPGPTVDDIEPAAPPAEEPPAVAHRIPGDVNLAQLQKHDPEAYDRVTAALENARRRNQTKPLPDDTDEQQDAVHRATLPEPAEVSAEFAAGGAEQSPDDMAALLADLEAE